MNEKRKEDSIKKKHMNGSSFVITQNARKLRTEIQKSEKQHRNVLYTV